MNKFVISGGVAANSKLIEMAEKMGEENNIKVYYPSKILSTDNAAMIGCAAYYDYINGKRDELSLKVYPNLELGQ